MHNGKNCATGQNINVCTGSNRTYTITHLNKMFHDFLMINSRVGGTISRSSSFLSCT